MSSAPPLLRLGTAAKRLGFTPDKLRQRLDADPPGVEIDGRWFPLRSMREGKGKGDRRRAGERKVRADDVAAAEAAIAEATQ